MRKKIIYGICGIGNGHTYRQEPVIAQLAKEGHQICIFAYGESLKYYSSKYSENICIKVLQVAIPFYIGSIDKGLDFGQTAQINNNNYFHINTQAMAEAQNWLGRPDLCVTDYEPVSAQYAYAYQAPVITFDQQSKYLAQTFPETLAGLSYHDEVMRLNMFFPLVYKRIACSFFDVRHEKSDLLIMPPILNKNFVNVPSNEKHYLLYISAQTGFKQKIDDIFQVLGKRKETFNLFISTKDYQSMSSDIPKNIHVYEHGNSCFNDILSYCHGVICTAGHTLISECMALGIPVYAIPLLIYEQQLNAFMVSEQQFGLMAQDINEKNIEEFILNEPLFRKNIQENKQCILLDSKNALSQIMSEINQLLIK